MKINSLVGIFLTSGSIAWAGPSRIEDLSAVATNGGVVMNWTAPTASGITTLTNLDVRYSSSPINSLNWSSASRVSWLIDPGTPSTPQTAIVVDLTPGTLYYFAIKTQDSDGYWSTMSNQALITAGDSTYSITLIWDPSPDPAATGYRMYSGTSSGVYDTSLELSNVTICILTNRIWGVRYYYAVSAFGGDEVSPLSNELEVIRP